MLLKVDNGNIFLRMLQFCVIKAHFSCRKPLDIPELNEQPVEQHDHPENVEPILRRSTRERKSSILSDYVVYMQESNFNIGAINDPETFSQAMNKKNQNYGSML